MQRIEGLHFYINIANLNEVIADEEYKTKKVNHSIHALDVFFSSIERFGKRHFESFVVEKVTGSRLHMYVENITVEKYRTSGRYDLSGFAVQIRRIIQLVGIWRFAGWSKYFK